MRRSCSDRIFCFLSALLIFYIGWYLVNSFSQILHDPEEEMTYLHAISGSSPMIHNVQLCSYNEIDFIIIIISSGSHFLERQAIRETWGSMSHIMNAHSQRLFVVGYEYGSHLYKDLSNEARNEQDLLYLTVNDNLMTLKELYAYRWLEKYCPNVTFTFKTEDDLFVNTFLLHEIIGELKTNPDRFQNRYLYNSSLDSLFLTHLNPDAHTFLFGWAFEPGKPERNASMGSYYVSYKEYSKDLYPRFGYLMDSKTRDLLVEEGFKDKYPFRFSDIFITGMLPERLNFICDALPFTYHQGTTQQCIDIIKKYNRKTSELSTPPLIVCSTGRHIAQNTFSDYYRIWTVLKYFFDNRIRTTRSRKLKN
ncbi:unnamed protein product [Rotaria sp. Silwood2]|nr:unnamed protein product [Rotaria sp. Silwood2]CAF2908206.1 unnamed protein product [Rotaria sp. Silwood2]CAF3091488.1 unnamed protein product [Rotaria sp. Silwood2]CAF3247965.1 unnamed protein product [Rotaria sp. Silwood2]CAF4192864.1 unnamed protein product [Rotaria sp. Silwood2]